MNYWYIGLIWVVVIAAVVLLGRGFGDTLKRQPLDGEQKNG